MKKKGVTLAEVLITLLFVGIIASLVMPSLVNNFKQKQYEVQVKSFKQKFQEGMDAMRLRNKLMPIYDSTMDFVKEMQKHFNISQVCDSSHLGDCFEGDFTAKVYDADGNETAYKTYSPKNLSDAKSVSPTTDIDGELVGVKFADGNGAIIARKSGCSGPSNTEINGDVYKCLGYIAFVGGSKSHSMGRDMITNMDLVSETTVTAAKVNPAENTNSPTEPEETPEENPYGLSFKIVDKKDGLTWDEAVAYCQAQGASLPNAKQLTEMANKIYLVEGANCTKSTIQYDPYYYDCNQSVIEVQPLIHYLSSGLIWSNNANGGALGPLYASFGMTSGLVGDNTFVFEQFTAVCVR